MLKFLMEHKCKITMKEGKGDTIRDHILRHSTKNTIMVNAYMKYEDKMVIKRIINPIIKQEKDALKSVIRNSKSFFRWNSPRFIKLFIKLAYQTIAKELHFNLIMAFFSILYLMHWFFFNSEMNGVLSILIHLSLLVLIGSLFIFEKSSIGTVDKLHISNDKDNNLVGQILYLLREKQVHKIEEMTERFCFDCLVIRPKQSYHCKKCNQCINHR